MGQDTATHGPFSATVRSRGNVDAMIQGWPRTEMAEASNYSRCL